MIIKTTSKNPNVRPPCTMIIKQTLLCQVSEKRSIFFFFNDYNETMQLNNIHTFDAFTFARNRIKRKLLVSIR